jgi:hypothetical protein
VDLGAPVLDHDPDPDYSLIGGASFIRGVPGQPTLLLRFMPAAKAVPPFDSQWLALVLTSQVFVGALLGIAAQAFLAIVVIFHVLPWFGLELLDTARDVANFDLPGAGAAVVLG